MASRSNPDPGEIMQFNEIQERGKHGQTVRVIGRLKWHDLQKKRVAIIQVQKNTSLSLIIDTTLVEPFYFKALSIFQFIGELDFEEDDEGAILHARVCRCVDGCNMTYYSLALQYQNKYFAERCSDMDMNHFH